MIEQEEAPFHFKIHLFQTSEDAQFDTRADRTEMMNYLNSFEATEVHI